MSENLYTLLLWSMVVLAPVVFLVLLFISAPYGRHQRAGWGPLVHARFGWLIMEAPASLLMFCMLWLVPAEPVIVVLLLLWQVHYFHRAFVYPFTLRTGRQMPLLVVLMAIVFNTINALLNGWHFVLHADWYDSDWLRQPHFLLGAACFFTGYIISKQADSILRSLRAPVGAGAGDQNAYRVPQGLLYRWVSCPNYLGEILQWFGWALMTLSPAGWVFLLWTIANLLPRALSHHRWYRQTFPDYPPERRALIPGLL